MNALLSIRTVFVTLCLLCAALSQAHGKPAQYEPREGDIMFQSSPRTPLIDAIEGATSSSFSHCGIVHRTNTRWVVIEAIGPVKETPLEEWIDRGRDNRYTVYRLKGPYRKMIPSFVKAAQSYMGLPYDIHYDLDDAAIYCSELVYKAYRKATGQTLGRLQSLGELHWQPYENVIRDIEDGALPLDRKMITPRALSEAAQLEHVYSSDLSRSASKMGG